jgi:hypothetical protein
MMHGEVRVARGESQLSTLEGGYVAHGDAFSAKE